MMRKFTQKPGVVASFRTPLWDNPQKNHIHPLHHHNQNCDGHYVNWKKFFFYRSSGDHYLGYHGWKDTNRQYQVMIVESNFHQDHAKYQQRNIIVKLATHQFPSDSI